MNQADPLSRRPFIWLDWVVVNDAGGYDPRIDYNAISPIPEPTSVALLGLASSLGFFIRRRFLA
jgi:hypothetical protein